MTQHPYDALMAHQFETEALAQIAGRLGWDQETMMPSGAGAQRAEEVGVLEAVLHARRIDPRMGEWLAAINDADLTEVEAAQMRHIRRSYARTVKLPEKLVIAQAKLASRAHGIWAEARETDDVDFFLPVLEEVIELKREEAAALADGGDLYDALLEEYEPGTTGDQIGAMFGGVLAALAARPVDVGRYVRDVL